MNDIYKKQIALLIRIMPLVYRIKDFAVHGGTAINLFYKNMPRYSVDIDLTYIPIQDRTESLNTINKHLKTLKANIEKTIIGIKVTPKYDVLKLLCTLNGATVKIEVNGIKRGIIGATEDKMLCDKAQQEFSMACKARIVSYPQLYGGKITAALSRQHPRDLFDCKYMEISSFDDVKDGFSDVGFSYDDYEKARTNLIAQVNAALTETDKDFILSFEDGTPDWSNCSAGDLSNYPSVKWKLQNVVKFKETNPQKHKQGIGRLMQFFGR